MRVVVMGVSGSGKTTVGQAVAERLGIPFYDGDDFHSKENKEKMHRGVPLTDADRAPWLAAIADFLKGKTDWVLACSALKAAYREVLNIGDDIRFVYLKGSEEVLEKHLRERHGHFFNPHLLKSQLATLEEPTDAYVIDCNQSIEKLINEVVTLLTRIRD